MSPCQVSSIFTALTLGGGLGLLVLGFIVIAKTLRRGNGERLALESIG